MISACLCASDMRSLCPKEWSNAASSHLRLLAITEDARLIGGYVRYFRSKELKLRSSEISEDEKTSLTHSLLLPLGRSLVANWTEGNRREAGVALSHISGSGEESSRLISELCQLLKQVEPVRYLEAMMASLRQSYDDWLDMEPEEIDSDRPTDEEMKHFEEAEKHHHQQFQALEHQASCFSTSLGRRKLSDKKIVPALLGFVCEGIRFAFSHNEDDEEDEVVLGSRLSFLSLLSKYAHWMKSSDLNEVLATDMEDKELKLKNHPEFDEVHEDDLAVLANFRIAIGLKASVIVGSSVLADDAGIQNEKDIDQSTYYEDSDSDHVASNMVSRTSLNQTASLSPLYEGNTPEEVEEKKGSSSIDNSSQQTYDADERELENESDFSAGTSEGSSSKKRKIVVEE